MSEGFCFKVNTSTYFLLKLSEKYESRSLGESSAEYVCISDFILLVLISYKAIRSISRNANVSSSMIHDTSS